MDEHDGSITHWLGDLRGGDLAAAQPLWERYFGRLVVLARAKLEQAAAPRARGRRGGRRPERLQQLLRRSRRGKVSPARRSRRPLANSHDHHRAQGQGPGAAPEAAEARRRPGRRGGRASGPEVRLAVDAASLAGLELIAGDEPTPEFAAMVAEEYQRLLDSLEDDGLRQVAAQPDGRATPTTRSPTSSAAPAGPSPGGST